MSDHYARPFKLLRMYCDASAIAAAVLGCLVLFGWAFHIEHLKSVVPGLVTMKANTALGLALSGTSLWLLLPGESHPRRRQIAHFLALLVTLIGAATLCEYLFGLNLRIDQLLFNEPTGTVATYSPGRMSLTSATAFLAIGMALLLLDWKTPRGHRPAQVLSLWAGAVAMTPIVGYIYNATHLYRILHYTQVALNTSIALFLLSGAIFFARPRSGIAADLTGEGSGSVMARRLLPAVFCIPILLGWISLRGQLAGWFGTELGLALNSTANVGVFIVLVWLSARKMNVEYSHRSRAEFEIRELNANLEGRVAERTKTLEQSELALRESSETVRLLLDSTVEAIYGIDMQGNCTLCNRVCLKLLGYWEAADLLGKNMHDVMHYMREDGTTYPVEDCHIYRAFRQSKGSHVDDEVFWRSDGTNFPTEYWSYPIFRDKQVIGAVVTFIDITERRQAEVALMAATAIAEDSNRAKSEFLANMSHELRTPLNGVLGMTDLLLDTGPTPEQLEYLETTQLSANSLLALVNDILDFSEIEAGKMDLEAIDFNLRDRLETALKMLLVRADEKGLELLCDIAPEVPKVVRGDFNRLRQVVTNLVGNAIKFTEIGKVLLKVQVEADQATNCTLRFTVSDTGVGIPADKLQVIFAPFSQADSSTTRKYGGTGLGLAISRHLVEKMGGKLWVESEVGRGSHFHFTTLLGTSEKIIEIGTIAAPGAREETGSIPLVTPHSVQNVRDPMSSLCVLLAEDNLVNQLLTTRLLEKRGHRAVVVTNGREVLEALKKENYDLVLMDVHMPEMDGIEATAAIREREKETGFHQPVIALTASVDRARCLAGGMDGHLIKPIQQRELDELLEIQLAHRRKVGKIVRSFG
ncbi:MAG TPA: ATP-binding protein [Candidatus Dormibacteraeota bacterium]|nr:ATP-binding protein [Candidatus Dormibacteraeota bacterium]